MTESSASPGKSDAAHDLPCASDRAGPRPAARLAKRGLDVVLATVALFMLAPLLLLVSAAIWAVDRGSPLVSEPTLGRGGTVFGCLRFRTTGAAPDIHDPDAGHWLAAYPPRPTNLGLVLERSSVAGLPRLMNVLRGEMSLVGPRAMPARGRAHSARPSICLSVPPGLTGAWQIGAEPDATDGERSALDVDYVTDWSLSRDLGIIVRRVFHALEGRDAL